MTRFPLLGRRLASAISLALAAALLISTGGCAALGEGQDDGEAAERATVRVDNQRSQAADVYAVLPAGGVPRRLGRVSAYRTETLELRPPLVSRNGVPLRFRIEMVGQERPPLTREVVVYPGDAIDIELRPF